MIAVKVTVVIALMSNGDIVSLHAENQQYRPMGLFHFGSVSQLWPENRFYSSFRMSRRQTIDPAAVLTRMTETDDPDDVSYKTRTRADSMIVYSTVSDLNYEWINVPARSRRFELWNDGISSLFKNSENCFKMQWCLWSARDWKCMLSLIWADS